MDEKAAQIIARVVEGKLVLWPQTGASAPQAMGDQSFILTHAALIRVLPLTPCTDERLCLLSYPSWPVAGV